MDEKLKELIKNYGKQQHQHPFLLVDLSGGKENTHTNILMSLLRFNDYMFFDSFLKEVLNVPEWDKNTNTIKLSTQRRAVGLKANKKSTGFIDLYIEYIDNNGKPQIIVIENKINGATDTPKQMLRYIASVKENAIKNNDAFDKWVNTTIEPSKSDINLQEIVKQECQGRHFVYLTSDNSKVPEDNSLPLFLRENSIIDYDSISYQDNILQWLKETVLRFCPYYDDGIAVAGLRQYIVSLEGMLSRNITVSSIVYDYVEEFARTNTPISSAYYGLINSIKELEDHSSALSNDNDIDTCNRLARELRKATEELVTKDSVPDGWVLHLSPTLLVLYRESWMRIARGSYSIPFVNFYTNPNNFLSGKNTKWQLHIEHFSPEKWGTIINKSKFCPTNHNRTASYDLGISTSTKTQDETDRKECINSVISKNKDIISIIDKVVDGISKNNYSCANDKEIRVALLEQLVKEISEYSTKE